MHKPAILRWRVVTPIHLCVSVSVCKLVCNLHTFANSQLEGKWRLGKIVGLTNAYNLCWMTRQCEDLTRNMLHAVTNTHKKALPHITRADTNFTWATMNQCHTSLVLLSHERLQVESELKHT